MNDPRQNLNSSEGTNRHGISISGQYNMLPVQNSNGEYNLQTTFSEKLSSMDNFSINKQNTGQNYSAQLNDSWGHSDPVNIKQSRFDQMNTNQGYYDQMNINQGKQSPINTNQGYSHQMNTNLSHSGQISTSHNNSNKGHSAHMGVNYSHVGQMNSSHSSRADDNYSQPGQKNMNQGQPSPMNMNFSINKQNTGQNYSAQLNDSWGHSDPVNINQGRFDQMNTNQGYYDQMTINQGKQSPINTNQGYSHQMNTNLPHSGQISTSHNNSNKGHSAHMGVNYSHVGQMNSGHSSRADDNYSQPGQENMNQGQPSSMNMNLVHLNTILDCSGQSGLMNTNHHHSDHMNTNQGKSGKININHGQLSQTNMNQSQPNQTNTNQGWPGQMNTNQGHPTQMNTNQGKHGHINTNQGQHSQMDVNQGRPSQMNTNKSQPVQMKNNHLQPGHKNNETINWKRCDHDRSYINKEHHSIDQAMKYNMPPPPGPPITNIQKHENINNKANTSNCNKSFSQGQDFTFTDSGISMGNSLPQGNTGQHFHHSTPNGMNTHGDGGYQSLDQSLNSPFLKGYISPVTTGRKPSTNRYSPYPRETSRNKINPPMPLTVRTAQVVSRCIQMENHSLLNKYHMDAATIESQRYQDLCKQSTAPVNTTAINNLHDLCHEALLDCLEHDLQEQQSMYGKSPIKFNMDSSTERLTLHTDLTPLGAAGRLAEMQHSTEATLQQQNTSAAAAEQNASLQHMSDARFQQVMPSSSNSHLKNQTRHDRHVLAIVSEANSTGLVFGQAVKIMNKWYERNYHFPYPTHRIIDIIRGATGLSVEQIKRWFNNRRQRDGNTCTMSRAEISQLQKERCQRGSVAQEQEEALLRQDIQTIKNT